MFLAHINSYELKSYKKSEILTFGSPLGGWRAMLGARAAPLPIVSGVDVVSTPALVRTPSLGYPRAPVITPLMATRLPRARRRAARLGNTHNNRQQYQLVSTVKVHDTWSIFTPQDLVGQYHARGTKEH